MSLSITAANVVAAAGTVITRGISGAVLTAGMPVYKDAAAANKYKKCDSDHSLAIATCEGITLNGASDGQPIAIAGRTGDGINLGATLTVGELYLISPSSGLIDPPDPVAQSGTRLTTLGIATAANNLQLHIRNTGVRQP